MAKRKMPRESKTPPAQATSTRPVSARPTTATSAALGTATDAAARRRIAQRRRQQIVQRVQRFEAVLPAAGAARRALRPGLAVPTAPAWRSWRIWTVLGNRWLWLVTALVVIVAAAVTWVHTDDRWFLYREDARITGVTYLNSDELWQQSGVNGWNLFWLDTNAVRKRLLANPYVADADVYVTPLAGTVTMAITESRPVALWVTDMGTRWILPSAVAVAPLGPTPPGLLQIVDPKSMATAPGSALGSAIDKDVLKSASSLPALLPKLAALRYNRQIGLNFQLQEKPYWVYWGDGANVERKLENLAIAEKLLAQGDVKGTVIDVRFERPYIK